MESATETYRVRSYEVDAHGRLTIAALCNYLQESAGLHARDLGVSVPQLQDQGMTWFLWRLHLRVSRWPSWTQTVAIETWPAALGRPAAIRDFRICEGETEIGIATSAWLLMDTERKRPIRRIPARIRDLHPEPPRRALTDGFKRLPRLETEGIGRELVVRRGDLDLNGHLNHVATINALIETVEPEVFYRQQLTALEVEFMGEGHDGDELMSCCESVSESLHHSLVRRADGKEIARGRSRWSR